VIRALLVGLVTAYRRLVSPFLPAACRFHPSCSAYAAAALERHGALRGSWLAARRVLRCHPWNPGGFDPVP
jgi:putative membrane protein insertion efficiency factor